MPLHVRDIHTFQTAIPAQAVPGPPHFLRFSYDLCGIYFHNWVTEKSIIYDGTMRRNPNGTIMARGRERGPTGRASHLFTEDSGFRDVPNRDAHCDRFHCFTSSVASAGFRGVGLTSMGMAQTTSWITATVNVNIINSSAEILASCRVIHVLCLLPTMGNRLPHRPSTRASSPDGVSPQSLLSPNAKT